MVFAGWFYEAFASAGPNRKQLRLPDYLNLLMKSWTILALSFCGLLLFTFYLWQHTGDPLAYQHAQVYWPGGGSFSNIADEIRHLLAPNKINMEYVLIVIWYAAAALALFGLAWLLRMKQWLLALYTLVVLSLPTLFSGTAASTNRYVQVALPLFIAYGSILQKQPRWVKVTILGACLAGMAIVVLIIMDPRGIFIANQYPQGPIITAIL